MRSLAAPCARCRCSDKPLSGQSAGEETGRTKAGQQGYQLRRGCLFRIRVAEALPLRSDICEMIVEGRRSVAGMFTDLLESFVCFAQRLR